MEGDRGREGKEGKQIRKAGEAVSGRRIKSVGQFGVGLRGSALVGGVPFRLMFWKLCHTYIWYYEADQ